MKCCAVILASFLLGLAPARANVTLTLSPSVQNSASGVEVIYSGTLTNNSATDQVFLNDISFSVSGDSATYLTPELNHFFANVPGILLPNENYAGGEIFRLVLGASAPSEDYSGSITILGGADIFAAGILATTSFTVLSPAVNIVATTSNASELGPVAGAFTFTRTGGTGADLPVSFAITGTAVNGSSYNSIVSPVTIPNGSSSATVTILPIPDNIAEGDRSAILTLTSSTLYNAGTPITDTVTVHDKPADNWRFLNFGAQANTPPASDLGDYNGDGIVNLVKYALNLNPLVSDNNSLPQPAVSSDGYLTLTFVPNPAATDVTLTVEASTDLVNWSTSNVQQVSIANPPPGSLTYQYSIPASQSPGAFLHLKVTR